MAYGIVCFALFFSFVGTVLGGIWADQSWGRFWGWDPKENGALLIVLWNAIILHARWGGYVRERGIMAMAIFGNVITALRLVRRQHARASGCTPTASWTRPSGPCRPSSPRSWC